MSRALVTLTMDTGLVIVDCLNSFVVFFIIVAQPIRERYLYIYTTLSI